MQFEFKTDVIKVTEGDKFFNLPLLDPNGTPFTEESATAYLNGIDLNTVWVTPTVTTQVSPIEFKLLFTGPERVAIKAARQTDALVDDFFDIIEDPRLTHVNLTLTSTQQAVGYLASQGLIAAERVSQILSGEFQ